MKETLHAAREALADIIELDDIMQPNATYRLHGLKDRAMAALALIDSALAPGEPATPPGDEVEAIVKEIDRAMKLESHWLRGEFLTARGCTIISVLNAHHAGRKGST